MQWARQGEAFLVVRLASRLFNSPFDVLLQRSLANLTGYRSKRRSDERCTHVEGITGIQSVKPKTPGPGALSVVPLRAQLSAEDALSWPSSPAGGHVCGAHTHTHTSGEDVSLPHRGQRSLGKHVFFLLAPLTARTDAETSHTNICPSATSQRLNEPITHESVDHGVYPHTMICPEFATTHSGHDSLRSRLIQTLNPTNDSYGMLPIRRQGRGAKRKKTPLKKLS